MLNYMFKEALKTYEKNLLYSKEKVQIPTKQDSRLHNGNISANKTDNNLAIIKFAEVINKNRSDKKNPLDS